MLLIPLPYPAFAPVPVNVSAPSCALPGHSGDRAVLAAPVDDRLFFAGEAPSANDFSTVHGAYATGSAAGEAVRALLTA